MKNFLKNHIVTILLAISFLAMLASTLIQRSQVTAIEKDLEVRAKMLDECLKDAKAPELEKALQECENREAFTCEQKKVIRAYRGIK